MLVTPTFPAAGVVDAVAGVPEPVLSVRSLTRESAVPLAGAVTVPRLTSARVLLNDGGVRREGCSPSAGISGKTMASDSSTKKGLISAPIPDRRCAGAELLLRLAASGDAGALFRKLRYIQSPPHAITINTTNTATMTKTSRF
ncbi:hypothetical protein BZ17_4299 (plasmid) [Yersinia pseudotuberculosis IP 32953]|nr:hypothetical protein BZ17_4299 [Yersinia pseudotuberculosis IP 32953]